MWPDATPSPPPLPRAPRAECEAATEMCLFMVPIGTAPLKGIVLLGTQRGRDLVLWRRAVARRDPTVGGALVEGIILTWDPPFHSHALCIDLTSRTGPPAGVRRVLGRCGGKGTDGVQNRRRSA